MDANVLVQLNSFWIQFYFLDLMADIQNYLTPKIDRGGIKYRFGWITTVTQPKFTTLLDLKIGSGPKVVLVNPGKRKRFFVMEDEITIENLSKK